MRAVDSNGTSLEIGDIVYFRSWVGHPFNYVGVVKSSIIIENGVDIMYREGLLGKFPENIRKMSDEEALLWKLEN